jgi:hypothetical protein
VPFVVVPLFDVLADSEYVLNQEKHARDHISHERLSAEPDRQAEYAGSRQQRGDLNTQGPESGQDEKH